MTMYLILSAIALILLCVKLILDLNSLVLRLRKDSKLNAEPNPYESKFQFIKGLY